MAHDDNLKVLSSLQVRPAFRSTDTTTTLVEQTSHTATSTNSTTSSCFTPVSDFRIRLELIEWVFEIASKLSIPLPICVHCINVFDYALVPLRSSPDLAMLVCFVFSTSKCVTLSPLQLSQIAAGRFSAFQITSTLHRLIALVSENIAHFDLHHFHAPTILLALCKTLLRHVPLSEHALALFKSNCFLFISLLCFLPSYSATPQRSVALAAFAHFLKIFCPSFAHVAAPPADPQETLLTPQEVVDTAVTLNTFLIELRRWRGQLRAFSHFAALDDQLTPFFN